VNLEQVGRTDETGGGHQIGIASVTGFDYSDLPNLLAAAASLAGFKISKDNKGDYFERSDNLPFAQAGIPAHTIYVAADFPDYHRVGDEWQKIDFANMARVDRAVALGLLRLSSDARPPQWNESNRAARRYSEAARKLR
jgi:Zn-dependent M28 family amino/carboxypeptidase